MRKLILLLLFVGIIFCQTFESCSTDFKLQLCADSCDCKWEYYNSIRLDIDAIEQDTFVQDSSEYHYNISDSTWTYFSDTSYYITFSVIEIKLTNSNGNIIDTVCGGIRYYYNDTYTNTDSVNYYFIPIIDNSYSCRP
jgi:hypothetical protein